MKKKKLESNFFADIMTNMDESRDSREQSVEENKENNNQGQNEKSVESEKPAEKNESQSEHSRSSREVGAVNSPPHGVPSQQSPVPAAVPPVVVTGKASNFSISSILGGGGGSRSASESLSSGSRGKDSDDEKERRDEAREGQPDHPQPLTRDAEKPSHASLMSEHMEKLGHAFTQVHPGSGGLHPSAALLGMRPEYLHYAAAAAVGLRGLAGIPGAVPPPPPSAHPLHPSQAALDASGKEDKLSPGKPIPWHPWFSHHPFLPMSYGGMYTLHGL